MFLLILDLFSDMSGIELIKDISNEHTILVH